jgi:hypothetical protein
MGREFVVPAEAFAGAGAESEGKAYLGDRATLEALFRQLFGAFLERWADVGIGDMESEAAGKVDLAEVERVAAILRGKDPAFVPMAKFNWDDLHRFITRWTGITDPDPDKVVQGWLANMLVRLHGWGDQYTEDAISLEEYRDVVAAQIAEACKLALGIRPDLDL